MYKVAIDQISNGRKLGRAVLVKDYQTLSAAVAAAEKNSMVYDYPSYEVREYSDTERAVVSFDSTSDTGTVVCSKGRATAQQKNFKDENGDDIYDIVSSIDRKMSAAFRVLASGEAMPWEKEEQKVTLEDIVFVHDYGVEKYGGCYEILDPGLLEVIAEAPYQEVFGQVVCPTVEDKAAKLFFDLANHQVFRDGNKRAAILASAQLEAMNGREYPLSGMDAYRLVMGVATHKISDPSVVAAVFKGELTVCAALDEAEKEEDHGDVELD